MGQACLDEGARTSERQPDLSYQDLDEPQAGEWLPQGSTWAESRPPTLNSRCLRSLLSTLGPSPPISGEVAIGFRHGRWEERFGPPPNDRVARRDPRHPPEGSRGNPIAQLKLPPGYPGCA